MIIDSSYNVILVLLSVAISVLGSYTSLRVARHIPVGEGAGDRLFWILIAAFALGGGGIWSMHFIGMLAFDLGIPVSYDVPLTIGSLIVAVVVTGIGFLVVARESASSLRFIGSGTLMGLGIAGMHYTGMAAMRMPADLTYATTLVIASIVIAIVASTAALWLAFNLKQAWQTIGGSLVMGLAVSGMHYTAMAAAIFRRHDGAVGQNLAALSPALLAYIVFLVSLLILAVAFSVAEPRARDISLFLRKKKWPRAVLAALLLGAAVAVPAVGWRVHSTNEKSLKSTLREELRIILNAEITALRIWLEDHQSAVEVAAAEPRLRAVVGQLVQLSEREGVTREALLASEPLLELRDYLNRLVRAYGYVEFAVIDRNGRMLGSRVDEAAGPDPPAERSEFIAKVLAGKTVISKPYLANVPLPGELGELRAGRPTMFAGAPVRDDRGQIIAGLGFRIRPEVDFTRILTAARSGESGETYAFDANGLMISESRFDDELRAIGLIPEEPDSRAILQLAIRDPGGNMVEGFRPAVARNEQPLTRMAGHAIRGDQGVDVNGYRDYRGVPVVGAWTWLPEYGFGVATEVDVAEAYATLQRVRKAFWALMGLLATSILGMLLSYRIINRLRRRVRQAQKLGRYTLDKKIGEGGMGTVYRAHHAMLRRPTAIKLLRAEHASEQSIARFEREVQLTSQLTHPNTIAIYDYGRTPEGVFYYAMEYLPGYTLDQLIDQHGPQPEGRVIHILTQVCASLAEAHSVGLIHRDIKPSNIILCKRGGLHDVVKVLDFGLVKEIKHRADLEITGADTVMGTPSYLSPEGIRAPDHVDARGDVYCVGAVGYYLLSGGHVFAGGSAIEVISHHLNTEPETPSARLGRPVSKDLEDLILRCLEKDKNRRPSSAGALCDAFMACVDAEKWGEEPARAWWIARAEQAGAKKPEREITPSDSGKLAETIAVAFEGRVTPEG